MWIKMFEQQKWVFGGSAKVPLFQWNKQQNINEKKRFFSSFDGLNVKNESITTPAFPKRISTS